MANYVPLHNHSHGSNIVTPDVIVTEDALVKKAKELGLKAIAITEHGTTFTKVKFEQACNKYGIKPIFGMEGYYVKDVDKIIEKEKTVRGKTKIVNQKDNSNGHIIFLAKNLEGLEEINLLMSDSYDFGFHNRPRVDTKMIKKNINPENVIITSACVGSFLNKYEESILDEFSDFINNGNFYLEMQAHNNKYQIEYNKKIMDISKRRNIPVIITTDTHAVDNDTIKFRDGYLKSKGINYEEEEGGWMIDLVGYDELFLRMQNQGVVPDELIKEYLENTNIINSQIEKFTILEDGLKVPILEEYKHLSFEERHEILRRFIYDAFEEYAENNVDDVDRDKYIDGIEFELNEIKKSKVSDYFLTNHKIINLAINKYGGVLTKTSRGSSSCYFTNFLLGFTAIDRFKFPKLPLFPQRFMTSERILEAKTPPDIDFNLSDPEAFILASKEVLGDENVYPMVALGLYQVKSSWKLFSRIYNIDPQVANAVSKSIEAWEKDMKYADDDHKDDINISDYIPEEYRDIFDESEGARSIIDSIKPHPCGVLVSPVNLRRRFGTIRVGKADNKIKCVAAEGWAEKLGFMKNDYLIVSVVDIIDKIYKKIGIDQPSPADLVSNATSDVYKIYEDGHTFEVNQFTSPRTIKYMKDFIPSNIYDLSLSVAAIRPGAISIVDKILKRKPYEFGIQMIDDILLKHTGVGSYVLYQESIMEMLNVAHIDLGKAYKILKAISKKKLDIIESAKEEFFKGLNSRILEEYSDIENESIIDSTIQAIWTSIEDSARYAFNAPHSLSTALDSLYIADLKTKYPKETYSVLLEYYLIGKKRNIGKVSSCKSELEELGYEILPIRFGQDNTKTQLIGNKFTQNMMSMKSSNIKMAEIMRDISDKGVVDPIEIYSEMKKPKNPNTNRAYLTKKHWKILCMANYFEGYNNKKLMEIIPYLYDKVYTKKQFRQSSLDKLFKDLQLKINIEDYCKRRTAKTFYLDEDKKKDLVSDLYSITLMPDRTFTIKEEVRNMISVYGFLPYDKRYEENNIYVVSVQAVSRKNNSILAKTLNNNNNWIKVRGDITQFKKNKNVVVLGAEIYFNKFKKKDLMITDYVIY